MGRVWLSGVEYVPETEVAEAYKEGRESGKRAARRHLGWAFGVTWVLLFVILAMMATAS